MTAERQRVFVYGTLRRALGLPVQRWLQRWGRYEGEGTMVGRLYDLGDYPGLVTEAGPGEQVVGELYQVVGERLLSILDSYEGCAPHSPQPHEYRRQWLPVTPLAGGTVYAWVYVYKRSVAGHPLIVHGDFAAHPGRRR